MHVEEIVEEISKEGWDIRETFAYFGRAFYMASVFEVGLAHALLFSDFLAKVSVQFRLTKGVGFDRKKYEIEFDAFIDKHFALTLGNLIKRIDEMALFDDALKKRIVAAKQRRDFLTHHYWRERSMDFATFSGRAAMRKELEDADNFQTLDRAIDAALKPKRAEIGIKDEWLEKHYQHIICRLKEQESVSSQEQSGV